MKTKTILFVSILLFFLINPSRLLAQGGEKSKEFENMGEAYMSLIRNAILKTDKSSKCNSNQLVSEIDAELKKVGKDYSLFNGYDFSLIQPGTWWLAPDWVDKGAFNSKADKILYIFSNSKNIGAFTYQLTQNELDEMNKKERDNVKKLYDTLEKGFKKGEKIKPYNTDGETLLRYKSCSYLPEPSYKVTRYKYPNITYEINISILVVCDCSAKENITEVESVSFEYSGKVKGIYAGSKFTYSEPTNPKTQINKTKCCPKDESSSQIGSDPSMDIFLNYVNNELLKKDSSQSSITENMFEEAQKAYRGRVRLGFNAGATVGEESDFYGINYGANVGYVLNKEESKFSYGPELEYYRFTGKETDFGFETEGESFVNIKGRGNISFNEWLYASLAAGYGIGASEGVDGGFTWDIGFEASPENHQLSSSTRIFYSLRFTSNSVEGGSFKSVNAGVGIKIK